MQMTTELGVNRSGMAVAPKKTNEKMLENIELTKPARGDEKDLAEVRSEFGAQAEPVGSLPEPKQEGLKALFMDKLGERLAFERSGTRLYDALMAKCKASGSKAIPDKELQHLRDEEMMHFALVGAAIQSLGGDPTAQTPCADVIAVASSGFMQVLTDPKTTPAQSLHAVLVAELADNAAWDELIVLADELEMDELSKQFTEAQQQEREHLETVRKWHEQLTLAQANA